jgi:hypothetical protein
MLRIGSLPAARRLCALWTWLNHWSSACQMGALQSIDVSYCKRLAADWLPAGCEATLHTLLAGGSSLHRITDGLTSLLYLDVSQCHLANDWLPPGSRAVLQSLVAWWSNLVQLPEGLSSLRELNVISCRLLAEDWLPASSAIRWHTLNAQL